MPHDAYDRSAIDRRSFVKASLASAALPLAAALSTRTSAAAPPAHPQSDPPEIIDSNVHLFDWPFRKLKYARTEALVAKLRRHRVTRAWACSFEAVLQKQLDQVNRRLAAECSAHGDGLFLPIGSVNLAWPDWQEDLRRCHEQYQMRGIRLYPAYHGYALHDPQVALLLAEAAKRDLLVQIVLRMEDERVHHASIVIAAVDTAPLVDHLKSVPLAKVQLLNSAGPLLANNVTALVRDTQVTFDISATEGNGGVGRLIEGTNYSYRSAIPLERLVFGSHAPFFPLESAVWKLFESPLGRDQLEQLMHANARRLIS